MGKVEDIKLAIENAEKGTSNLTSEVLDLPAFNTYKIKHLLNNLGALSKNYLECGLHKCGGFICTLYGNNLQGIGVDNWTQFEQNGESKKIAYENCEKYLGKEKYIIKDADCFKIKAWFNDNGIENYINHFDLYTYDADHSYDSQYNGITKLYSLMSDHFILCIDDTEWQDPIKGTMDAIKDMQLEILFHRHLFDGVMGGTWWNGFDVFYLKKTK